MKLVVLTFSSMGIHDGIASIHRADCRDVKRDASRHSAYVSEFDGSVDDALEDFIDAEMSSLGWTTDDVRVYPCTEKTS